MSSSGQGQQRPVTSTSASESASHSVRRHPPRRFVGRIRAHNGCEQPQQITKLLDHLVGACEQRGRDGEAERLRGLDIDDKLEFGRLFDRQIAGIGALENSIRNRRQSGNYFVQQLETSSAQVSCNYAEPGGIPARPTAALSRCSKLHRYWMTSSAVACKVSGTPR
jgi:hypothetical protein